MKDLKMNAYYGFKRFFNRIIVDASIHQWKQIKTRKIYITIFNHFSPGGYNNRRDINYCLLFPPKGSIKCASTLILVCRNLRQPSRTQNFLWNCQAPRRVPYDKVLPLYTTLYHYYLSPINNHNLTSQVGNFIIGLKWATQIYLRSQTIS